MANMVLAERIRLVRGNKSQKEFGESVGSTAKAVCHWETQGCVPRKEVLNNILTVYGVNKDWLLGKTDQNPFQTSKKKAIAAVRGEWECLLDKQIMQNTLFSGKTVKALDLDNDKILNLSNYKIGEIAEILKNESVSCWAKQEAQA